MYVRWSDVCLLKQNSRRRDLPSCLSNWNCLCGDFIQRQWPQSINQYLWQRAVRYDANRAASHLPILHFWPNPMAYPYLRWSIAQLLKRLFLSRKSKKQIKNCKYSKTAELVELISERQNWCCVLSICLLQPSDSTNSFRICGVETAEQTGGLNKKYACMRAQKHTQAHISAYKNTTDTIVPFANASFRTHLKMARNSVEFEWWNWLGWGYENAVSRLQAVIRCTTQLEMIHNFRWPRNCYFDGMLTIYVLLYQVAHAHSEGFEDYY